MNNTLAENLVWELTPQQVVAALPRDPYIVNRQPTYEDLAALERALGTVQQIEPVATPESILATRRRLRRIALGTSNDVVIIQGNCDEPVGKLSPGQLASNMLARRSVIATSTMGKRVFSFERGLGQAVKPRSAAVEIVDGTEVAPYMGGMVNAVAKDERRPDPERLVRAIIQARDTQTILGRSGQEAISAHEALLLPFERSRLARDEVTDQRFLLSAVLPWVGDRTSDPDGVHVGLLSNIENPVGIKVGDGTTRRRITGWVEKLNPNNEPGKLVFMIRISDDKPEVLNGVLQVIQEQAPYSILLYDLHAVTRLIDGHKVRAVPDIIKQIHKLAAACEEHGLVLHGLHLETMSDGDHTECVDDTAEQPTRAWSVDPQLNPQQLFQVLNASAPVLQRKVLA